MEKPRVVIYCPSLNRSRLIGMDNGGEMCLCSEFAFMAAV